MEGKNCGIIFGSSSKIVAKKFSWIMNYSQKCLNFLGNGSKKKLMDKSINGFKKKHVGFLGFLAHLEQKFF